MKTGWLLVLLLVVVAIAGLAGYAGHPLLYAPEKDNSTSQFHANPVVLTEGATNSTDDVARRMQAILNYHEPIIALLTTGETAAAERNLTAYDSSSLRLQETVAKLGAGGGPVQVFLATTKEQGAILRELAGQAEVMEALSTARERAGNDTGALATIARQAEAVQENRKGLINRYLTGHAIVMGVSPGFRLNTSSYENAGGKIRKILEEAEAPPAIPPEDLPVPAGEEGRITLLVEPGTAAYGDTVQVFGLAAPAQKNQTVVLSLDGIPFLTGTTGSTGNYYARFTVERIAGGTHTISATTGKIPAVTREFFIATGGTTTTLTATPGYHNWTETGVYCGGEVMADRPVRNAPVTILADGQPALSTTTAENGSYWAFVPLKEGGHALAAEFSGAGYPLASSVSSPLVVAVPSAPIRLADLLGAAALILLVLGAVFFWIVRSPQKTEPSEPENGDAGLDGLFTDAAPAPLPDHGDLPPEIGTLYARYQAILKEEGLSEAARKAYLDLAARIAVHLRLPAYRTLTPRELSGACSSKSYAGIFDIFVDSYERIRYGGSTKGPDKTGFEQELKAADTETGRGKI